MKYVLMLIAVSMLAMPALASVTISCVDNGNCTFNIVSTSTETGNIRAFALNVSVDGGQTIMAGSNWNASYNVCPGSYVSSSNLGTPICNGSKYPGTLGGLTTSGVTLEMASLYAPGQPAPGKTGVVLGTLTVSGACNVTLAANTIRGGSVIMEDPTATPTVTLNGIAVTCSTPCPMDIGEPIDGWIGPEDVAAMLTVLSSPTGQAQGFYIGPGDPGYNIAWDFNADEWLGPEDVAAILTVISSPLGQSQGFYIECP